MQEHFGLLEQLCILRGEVVHHLADIVVSLLCFIELLF